jgi:hypothetical protein
MERPVQGIQVRFSDGGWTTPEAVEWEGTALWVRLWSGWRRAGEYRVNGGPVQYA